jgi:phage tail protein E|nr:MAG TPA: tail assembly chaperone protein [Caudoviricetes sp.]
MDKITIKLKTPIQFGREEISELNIRRPIGRDLMGLEIKFSPDSLILDAKTLFQLVGKLTAIPPNVLAQMDTSDTFVLSMEMQGFLLDGLQIGQTTPQ